MFKARSSGNKRRFHLCSVPPGNSQHRPEAARPVLHLDVLRITQRAFVNYPYPCNWQGEREHAATMRGYTRLRFRHRGNLLGGAISTCPSLLRSPLSSYERVGGYKRGSPDPFPTNSFLSSFSTLEPTPKVIRKMSYSGTLLPSTFIPPGTMGLG